MLYAQYRGYEGPSNDERISASTFADLAYGEDYDPEDDDTRGAEWQLAMREKEEELAERALRRIRRARMRGDSNVDLSREELDALERRRHRQELERRPNNRAPPGRQQAAPTASSQAKRKSTSAPLGSVGFPKSKPTKSNRRMAGQELPVAPQHDLSLGSSSNSLSKLGNGSPRASQRNSRTRLQQQAQPPVYDFPTSVNYRPSSSRSSRRADASPTRSLPDDPDWTPRSRSSSSAQAYQYGASDRGADTLPFMAGSDGRRIVSEPMPTNQSVAYSSVRRNPPRQAQMGVIGGRPREIIDVSDDEDELVADGDSDDGVRIDVVPEGHGNYSVQQGASASGGGPRARKGKGY